MKQPHVGIRLMLLVPLLSCLATAARAERVQWQSSWSQAQSVARAQGKPIMIDFYTDWCGWCKRLDAKTYTDPNVVSISEKFVSVKLDAERDGTDLAAAYGVEGFPDIIFTSPEGSVIHRLDGYAEAPTFALHMQYALARFAAARSGGASGTKFAATTASPETQPASGALAAPPQPTGSFRSIRSSQAARDAQARLDAAAAHLPNGMVLEGSNINQDPNALLLVAPDPAVPRPAAKATRPIKKAKRSAPKIKPHRKRARKG